FSLCTLTLYIFPYTTLFRSLELLFRWVLTVDLVQRAVDMHRAVIDHARQHADSRSIGGNVLDSACAVCRRIVRRPDGCSVLPRPARCTALPRTGRAHARSCTASARSFVLSATSVTSANSPLRRFSAFSAFFGARGAAVNAPSAVTTSLTASWCVSSSIAPSACRSSTSARSSRNASTTSNGPLAC